MRIAIRAASILSTVVLGVVLVSPLSAAETDDANLDIVGKYLNATKTQQNALRGAQMEVDIDAKLPKLSKQGKLRALRFVSTLGKITYKALGFSGDNTVKQEVIARYLSLETEDRDTSSVAVTPANYKFQLKAVLTQSEQKTYIFQLNPKKKRVGLFKGEIWLDGATGMPVRESGRWVKSPSVFVKKVEFVQEFALQDGVALPSHIESTIDTHIAGKAELSINFTNFTWQASDQAGQVDEDSPGH